MSLTMDPHQARYPWQYVPFLVSLVSLVSLVISLGALALNLLLL